jgi:Flp pilus assembly protein TadB
VLFAVTPIVGVAAGQAATGSGRATSAVSTNEARIGGRGFGRRPTFSSRRPSARRPTIRRPIRRRPLFRHGFFNSVLRALGIAYLVHLLFGWGAGGGSPLGVLLVIGIVWWLVTRRRRRRPVYW